MSGNELVALLGKPADDPEVVGALADYAVRWPPVLDPPDPDDDDPDWYVFRPSSARGLEFGFQDEAHLRARDPAERGQGPLVLSQLYFYGQHEGVQPFQEELPFGVSHSDSPAAVRAKLTAVAGAPRSHRRDVWDAPGYRIVVQHVPHRDLLDSLMVKLRLAPWPPPEAPPKLPTIAEIIALFGQPWHAPDMRRVFFPLGLDTRGPDIAKRHYADLRRAWGIELHFFADPKRDEDNPIKNKGAGFTGIKFFGPRYMDARAWGGELPNGLSFAEALPSIVNKLGRKPDKSADGNLDGFALWNLPNYTLHVLYNNVDNVIECISLFALGSWR